MITQKYTEEKFKILFQNSPIGMSLIDHSSGVFLEINQYLLDSTGYTKEEFINLSFWDLTPKEYKKQEEQQIEDLNNNGKFGPNEKEYIKKDGTRFYIKISGFSLVDENDKKVVWNLIEDISEKKQYEIIYQDSKNLLECIAIKNNLQTILDKIVKLAESRFSNMKCSILLLDKIGKHLIIGSSPSLPDFYNEAINGIEIGEKIGSCGRAAYTKKRVIVDNIDTHENWRPYLELTSKANLHACWSEPILSSSNEVLGTFVVYNGWAKSPSEFELMLIETYANIASKAIEKYYNTHLLQVNEYKLEQLFNNSQSGLLYIDENGKLIKANERSVEILGYNSPDEMLDFNMKEFYLNNERFLKFGKKNFITLITNQKKFNIEYELKKKDGTVVWCEIAGKALDNNIPADLSMGILWTINDISLRKKYEFELEEKQLLLKTLLIAIPDVIYFKDTKGTYLICNSEIEKFFGVKESDIIGKTDYDFLDKEVADAFRLDDLKALNSDDVHNLEEWVAYADNSKNVLLDTSKIAIRNSKDEVIGVLGICHDVTKRELRNKELDKNKKKLEEVLEASGEGIWDWNIKTSHVEHNNKWYEILGLEYNEDMLDDFTKLIHVDDRDKVLKKMRDVLSSTSSDYQSEHRLIKKDGSIIWVIDKGRVVEYDEEGNPVRLAGSFSDITERKNMEFELMEQNKKLINSEKLASMGEMLGNIAHQWRQPLSIISTASTGAKLKKEMNVLSDKDFNYSMNLINDSAQYLSSTIDDFKRFLDPSNNKVSRFNISNTFDKTLNLLSSHFDAKEIELIDEIDNSELLSIENELIQVLMNILNNAIDALLKLDNQRRLIFIKTYRNENNIFIEIKDNAKGIPTNIIDRIFEPYFTTKHESQGTGIGLYMSAEIIKKHLKGILRVENTSFTYESIKYNGALFTIEICSGDII